MNNLNTSTEATITDETAIGFIPCYQQCFCSDNLELMKTIESNTIDLIYCDILYGTGRNFGDYQDLKPIRSEIESHYIPRLKEMHRILKPTGSIYLQMDTRINHWIRCIMDDVFGYDNFLNEIIWHYQAGTKPKNNIGKKHDIILQYKNGERFVFNDYRMKSTNPKKYNKTDENGDKYLINGQGKKYYLKDGRASDDVWSCYLEKELQLTATSSEKLGYATQKPKALIERIIKASSNEGDTVADFYMGSGTTAEVCKELNRNFIGCDINHRAVEITLQRLNNARS